MSEYASLCEIMTSSGIIMSFHAVNLVGIYSSPPAFSALTLLVGWEEEHPAHKELDWWGASIAICLKRGANDLHMVQLMPLPPQFLCFSKIQNCLSFWYRLTLVVLEKRPFNVYMFVGIVCRHADRGVSGSVRCQLQRGSAGHSALRLVLLASRVVSRHVPYQRYLHGVSVKRRRQQGRTIGDRTHPQAPGRVSCLEWHPQLTALGQWWLLFTFLRQYLVWQWRNFLSLCSNWNQGIIWIHLNAA